QQNSLVLGWQQDEGGPNYSPSAELVTIERGERKGEKQFVNKFVSNDMIIFWRTANQAVRVPSFQDPGIRAKVVDAWRLKEARDRAERAATTLSKNPELRKALTAQQDPASLMQTIREMALNAGSRVIDLKDQPVTRQVREPVADASLEYT